MPRPWQVYSARALSAALTKLLAPDGVAYLMNVATRPGANALAPLLEELGELEEEALAVCHSYGRAELTLTTFRRKA